MKVSGRRNLVVYAVCLVLFGGLAGLAYYAGDNFDKVFGPPGFLGIDYNDSLVIVRVLPNSPAEDAGLKSGDRIVSINGIKAVEQSGVGKLVSGNRSGSTIKITVLREGVKMTFSAKLIERP